MSSPSPCAEDIIGRPTVAATRLVGGGKPAWIQRSRLGHCGWNRIPYRRLKPKPDSEPPNKARLQNEANCEERHR